MSLFAGLNPWITMWSQPRSTIRAIVHSDSSYGIYYLAALYALQSFFFYANWWSVGLEAHYSVILALGVVLSPLLGLIWLYILGAIYYFTGRLLRGEATSRGTRACIAWSTIPFSISLLMWLCLIFLEGQQAFIHNSSDTSSLFINLIMIIVGCWSLVLLIQSIREVQQFSMARAILNVILAWVISYILAILAFLFFRYLYIQIFV